VNHELFASQRRAWDRFLQFSTVLGVGVGPKVSGGRVGAREAIIVLVGKKLPRKDVPKGELIPPLFEGFATDVREPLLMILPDAKRRVQRSADWCRTDAQWIDWIKIHRMNIAQQQGAKPRRRRR
jgi:hypothetical protein